MSEESTGETPNKPGQRVFATTQWSLVVAAANNDSSENSSEALEQLCQNYWYPLYAYVRRRGFSADESSDLTQAFFAQFLERNAIEHADPERGKFRTFLLTSLKNFIANQWRSDRAQKRGGHLQKISLEFARGEEQYALEPVDSVTPENLFDRKCALTLLSKTFDKLQEEYNRSNKSDLFDRIKTYLVGNQDKVPYREVSEELGITESAVKVAVHRMRKRCGLLLRNEIAQTVSSEEEVDQELREMYSTLGNKG